MANFDQQNNKKMDCETPLSPVLCNKSSRRMIMYKRRQKKSRVKLTDRFVEGAPKTAPTQSNDFTLSASQEENLLESIELLENDWKKNESQTTTDNFDFKKPQSPVVKKTEKPPSTGFQTAGGKVLELSSKVLKESQNLFQDILNPRVAKSETRCNKYSFLSRTDLGALDIQVSEESEFDKIGGFQMASGKNIQISENALKLAKNKFGDELSETTHEIINKEPKILKENIGGFQKASGKNIQISQNALKQAKNKFINDTENLNEFIQIKDKFKSNIGGFQMASGKNIQITENALKQAKSRFGDELNETTHLIMNKKKFLDSKSTISRGNIGGFQMASGKNVQISENALKQAKSRLGDEFSETTHLIIDKENLGDFQKASGKNIQISENALKSAKNKFGNELNEADEKNLLGTQETNDLFADFTIIEDQIYKKNDFEQFKGFNTDTITESQKSAEEFLSVVSTYRKSKCLGIRRQLNYNSRRKITVKNRTKKNCLETDICQFEGFSTTSGKQIQTSEAATRSARIRFDVKPVVTEENCRGFTEQSIQKSCKKAKAILGLLEEIDQEKTLCADNKTLSCTSVSLSKTAVLNESSFTSQNSSFSLTSSSRKRRLGVPICKPIKIPTRILNKAIEIFDNNKSTSSPLKTNNPTIYNSTPLKNAPFVSIESEITPIKCVQNEVTREDFRNDRIVIQECTNTESADLENELRKTEAKLRMLRERQQIFNLQKYLLDNNQDRKRQVGVLFTKKQNNNRIPLKQILKMDKYVKSNRITPQNSEKVHFNFELDNIAHINTLDGAYVIPNIQNLIGLTEIERAFKTMPGVEKKLIPNGWIRNHYKWIVWKLASYENFNFDCLSVENVIQQLKYRYDREIDRVERSTLRKIFEKDDSPQKRMILCVSDIFKLNQNKFELELTDGWYCIRTSIDEPLYRQIITKKIQIGTKLVIFGAELLNCDGCHPLEATDLVRLKINCNSTRRALWYAKLGYQKELGPYPLKLETVYTTGGPIGCIKIYIARVYPIKYLEKQNSLSVWRNHKAEEIRAQEWENKRHQDLENVKETIRKDYELKINQQKENKISINLNNSDIRNINCPETLFSIYNNCRDPERLQEELSFSQKLSISNYQQKLMYLQQQEISQKIKDSICKFQTPERDVTSVLTLLVIDALDTKEKSYVCQIWKPTDSHLEILKETSVCYVYNVLMKNNGRLSTTSRTKFKLEHETPRYFSKYKRTFLSISEIVSKPKFNEFDTVGIVIQMSVDSFNQNLWLADCNKRLLFIKIFDGPKNCLLLDKLKTGQLVAISNLVFCKFSQEFVEAIANHSTVVSLYPKYKHLQDALYELNEQIPKDMDKFLEEMKQIVSVCIDKIDLMRNKNMSLKSLISTNSATSDVFDDSTDDFYSMIDVDKLQ